jgi:hypothetical protein
LRAPLLRAVRTWTPALAQLHLAAIPPSGCLTVQLAQGLTHMPYMAEWGAVCDRYDPPLPTLKGQRAAAVFKEIQKLPQVICVICSPPASAVPHCTPTPLALLSAYPGHGAGRAFETATTRSPPPGCAAKCEAPHLVLKYAAPRSHVYICNVCVYCICRKRQARNSVCLLLQDLVQSCVRGEGGDIGGHVLRETTSRGLCGLVCPSRTRETVPLSHKAL